MSDTPSSYEKLADRFLAQVMHQDVVVRRGFSWEAMRFLRNNPEYADRIRSSLVQGLHDVDPIVRVNSVWGLKQLVLTPDQCGEIASILEAIYTQVTDFFQKQQIEHYRKEFLDQEQRMRASSVPDSQSRIRKAVRTLLWGDRA